jgi:hypothetical protein
MKTSIALSVLLGNLSINQAVNLSYAYGSAQEERDSSSGYPSLPAVLADHKFVNDYIEKSTGRFLTPYEVELTKAKAREAE